MHEDPYERVWPIVIAARDESQLDDLLAAIVSAGLTAAGVDDLATRIAQATHAEASERGDKRQVPVERRLAALSLLAQWDGALHATAPWGRPSGDDRTDACVVGQIVSRAFALVEAAGSQRLRGALSDLLEQEATREDCVGAVRRM